MFTQDTLNQFAEALVPVLLAKMKIQSATPKRLMTAAEAGEYIGRTANAVQILASKGGIPVVKTDARTMFDVKDLDRWIENGKRTQ